jgi:Uma2 family endonuclease
MEINLDFPYNIKLKDEYLVIKPDVSEEEFWEISNEDTHFELIDEVLYINSPASIEHEEIFRYLMIIFSYYFEVIEKGKVLGSRIVMRLSPKWNPEPDLIILLPSNYHKIKENKVDGAADLVVEILSKSTKDTDLGKKLPKYLEVGVREVWIINPLEKEIEIHRKDKVLIWKKSNMEEPLTSFILPKLDFLPTWLWNREKFPPNLVIEQFLKNKN